jgi:hypothetical protein
MAVKGAFGWNDMDVVLFGSVAVHITQMSYSVTREKANGYGKGSKPVRRSRGKKTYEDVTMSLAMSELLAIRDALKAKYGDGFDLTDVEPFDIAVSYDNGQRVVVDVIKDFEWTKDGGGGSEGDQDIIVELPGICSDILFNQTI